MEPVPDPGQWVFWFRMLVDVLLKSAVVVGIFGVVALAVHRSSAALRSRVWALAGDWLPGGVAEGEGEVPS